MNAELEWAAVGGEEPCVTTLLTAAKKTKTDWDLKISLKTFRVFSSSKHASFSLERVIWGENACIFDEKKKHSLINIFNDFNSQTVYYTCH